MCYSDVELVALSDPLYRKWCTRRAKDYYANKPHGVDNTQRRFTKEIEKWESVLKNVIASSMCEVPKRILRFRDNSAQFFYREMDFVAQMEKSNCLTIMEFKLKSKFKSKMGSKESGLKQIKKIKDVLASIHQPVIGMCVCVDMSALYGVDSDEQSPDIKSVSDVANSLPIDPSDPAGLIWVSGVDLADRAENMGIIDREARIDLKNSFLEKEDPLRILEDNSYSESRGSNNCPFSDLRTLLNTDEVKH